MSKVVDVLMKRDGMSEKDAKKHLEYVRELMNDAISCGNYDDAEDIMYTELGLEMDYIFDVI